MRPAPRPLLLRLWRRLTIPAPLLLLLAGGALAGCSQPPLLRLNPAETHGKVYYLDGIGCYGIGREEVPSGLRQAGYQGDVEYWNWSPTHSPLDQFGQILGAVMTKSKDLATMIQMYRTTYPGRPISLIGLSAGTGVAVFACEQLPEGISVDEVILVASSLSERYNLVKALHHITGKITLYQTSGDLALGVAARMTGTIDQAPLATAAGLVGFKPPDGLTAEQRELYRNKVVNVEYRPSFAAWGFTGDHTSAVESRGFVRAQIAPILMTGHPCEPGTDGRPPGPLSAGRFRILEARSGQFAIVGRVD